MDQYCLIHNILSGERVGQREGEKEGEKEGEEGGRQGRKEGEREREKAEGGDRRGGTKEIQIGRAHV